MGITLYTNQFGQQVAVGDIDLGIQQTGKLAGILSPNQASPAVTVAAGAPAKIDTTITNGFVVNFLQAAPSDSGIIGLFARTTMEGVYAIGDIVEVAMFAGTVMWMLSNATVTPGATAYLDSSNRVVGSGASAKSVGLVLDYGTAGTMVRVLISAAFGVSA